MPSLKCSAGHLSDDEKVETPMPGRVRRVIKHRRQQKVAEVGLIESMVSPAVTISSLKYRTRSKY